MSKQKEECAYRKGFDEGFRRGIEAAKYHVKAEVGWLVEEHRHIKGDDTKLVCSKCHSVAWSWYLTGFGKLPAFCPNCGVQIKGMAKYSKYVQRG